MATYYEKTDQFIKILKAEGLNELADELSEKVKGIFSSTELLMVTHTYLSKALEIKLSEFSKKKINLYLVEIEKILDWR